MVQQKQKNPEQAATAAPSAAPAFLEEEDEPMLNQGAAEQEQEHE
jgi:hypothetical protein